MAEQEPDQDQKRAARCRTWALVLFGASIVVWISALALAAIDYATQFPAVLVAVVLSLAITMSLLAFKLDAEFRYHQAIGQLRAEVRQLSRRIDQATKSRGRPRPGARGRRAPSTVAGPAEPEQATVGRRRISPEVIDLTRKITQQIGLPS